MTAPAPQPSWRRFPAGELLTRQGEPGDCAWLIDVGELEVRLDTPQGPKLLGRLGRGSLVGEMALIDDGVRSATVRAVTDVTALEMTRATFDRLLGSCEPLARYLLESLIAAIRRAYGAPPPERREGDTAFRSSRTRVRILDRRVFDEGHVFFQQGAAATSAYLIQAGRVAIHRDGTPLAELGPGRIFGELALLGDKPRAATATALALTTCEILRKEEFDAAIASMPPILRSLTRIYVEQLSGPKRRG